MRETTVSFAPVSSAPGSARGLLRRLRAGLSRLQGDRRGVAAIEFAFIAPVLLSVYFMTMEVSQAVEINKKVGRVGSMVADLLTQQQKLKNTDIEAVLRIGESILQPYNRSKPTITATGIFISDQDSPQARVVWSRRINNGAMGSGEAADKEVAVPAEINIRNTFLVRVESELSYKPVIAWSAEGKPGLGLAAAFDGISMKETYYLRPRMSARVECDGC